MVSSEYGEERGEEVERMRESEYWYLISLNGEEGHFDRIWLSSLVKTWSRPRAVQTRANVVLRFLGIEFHMRGAQLLLFFFIYSFAEGIYETK